MPFSQKVDNPTLGKENHQKPLKVPCLLLERQDTCFLLDILYAPQPQPQPWSLFAGAFGFVVSFCTTVRPNIDGRSTLTPAPITFSELEQHDKL